MAVTRIEKIISTVGKKEEKNFVDADILPRIVPSEILKNGIIVTHNKKFTTIVYSNPDSKKVDVSIDNGNENNEIGTNTPSENGESTSTRINLPHIGCSVKLTFRDKNPTTREEEYIIRRSLL